jgi:hypothetical protein
MYTARMAFISLCVLITTVVANAQLPEDYHLHFDTAHIIGTNNSIIVHRVPVTNTVTDETKLKDVTIDFAIGADGEVTITGSTSSDSGPLPNSASNFLPGEYEGGDCNTCRYIVSVGGSTPDGRVSGSIKNTDGRQFSATWITGPIEGNQLVGSSPIASELTPGQTYGVVGIGDVNGFCRGGIIAVSQIASSLVITAYHTSFSGCPTQSPVPISSWSLLRVPEE